MVLLFESSYILVLRCEDLFWTPCRNITSFVFLMPKMEQAVLWCKCTNTECWTSNMEFLCISTVTLSPSSESQSTSQYTHFTAIIISTDELWNHHQVSGHTVLHDYTKESATGKRDLVRQLQTKHQDTACPKGPFPFWLQSGFVTWAHFWNSPPTMRWNHPSLQACGNGLQPLTVYQDTS